MRKKALNMKVDSKNKFYLLQTALQEKVSDNRKEASRRENSHVCE